jgi:hypothetical protein
MQTLSQYVKFIAFPLQQWLNERAPVLRYKYNARLAHFLPACLSR